MNIEKSRKLSNGSYIPLIGLGTWDLKGETCERAVKMALDLGYSHFDTAASYDNEIEIGKGIKGICRENIFITSKVWEENLSFSQIIHSCESSLNKLNTNYLDLYLLHWPNETSDYSGILDALNELIHKQRVKNVGVSNFTITHLEHILADAPQKNIRISVNQVEFHPGLYQKNLLDFCNKKKIAITAYSPLAIGRLEENPNINELCKKYDKKPAQICIRWLLEKRIISIPRSSSKEHMAENLDVFDFKLDSKDSAYIDSMGCQFRIFDPNFFKKWGEL